MGGGALKSVGNRQSLYYGYTVHRQDAFTCYSQSIATSARCAVRDAIPGDAQSSVALHSPTGPEYTQKSQLPPTLSQQKLDGKPPEMPCPPQLPHWRAPF